MVRMRSDPRTQAYVQRWTQEGLSHKEDSSMPEAIRRPRNLPASLG